jgi:hypothetical protein
MDLNGFVNIGTQEMLSENKLFYQKENEHKYKGLGSVRISHINYNFSEWL